MNDSFHGQSTKENYRSDIEDSLKQKTVYKNYEYYDDYSYGNSDKIGVLIVKNQSKKNKYLASLYLFQSDGPKDKSQLRKLLEWRRSGISDEVGHKGGGNKRNIYGFKSVKTSIFSKLKNELILYCETKPNDIYNLATSNIGEQQFRNIVDTSEFIKIPEEKELDELPSWYNNIYNIIKSESNIEPNYLIRMDLSEIPNEYTCNDKWNEYLKQVRSKQYDIPIYFKNELLNMNEYKIYKNIDMVGMNNKENYKILNLYIQQNTLEFYIKDKEKFINVNTDNIITETTNMLVWGNILMYVVNETYFIKELKEYNDNIDNKLKAEDLYGVYLKINNKFTNYLPIEGNLLGAGKNNGIISNKSNNTNRFRMIIEPNSETCINFNYFNALIRTETIKALSGFLDKSPFKKIIKKSMEFYRGKNTKLVINPRIKISGKMPQQQLYGGVYIIYLGMGLWKFGHVTNYNQLHRRIEEHKNQSITKVNEFVKKEIKIKNATLFYSKKTISPLADEEKIKQLIINNLDDIITIFQNNGSCHEIREYFICNNIDYIIQYIVPLI